jgi:hypothetical protein
VEEEVFPSEKREWHGYICFSDDGIMLSMWSINGLWHHAASLPIENVPLSSLEQTLAETLTLTKREMAAKVRRIMAADLECPIIFSERGWLMDGSHRIMKALALGHDTIKAVRFLQDPEPDHIKPISEVQLG